MAQYLRLRIEPHILDNKIGQLDWGINASQICQTEYYIRIQENGTWTGVLGRIHNRSVDTACLFFQRTQLRADYFAFSYPVRFLEALLTFS